MKVLFVCNQNQHRSRAAERLFKSRYETRSTGLYNETPVTSSQLVWADVIVVMEEAQREELGKRFPKLYLAKRIVCVDIPDIYSFEQPELYSLLETKVPMALDSFLK